MIDKEWTACGFSRNSTFHFPHSEERVINLSLNTKEIVSELFGNCLQMNDENTEVLVTLDYGPRIVSIHTNNGRELIYQAPDAAIGRPHGHKMRITFEKSTNGIYCDHAPVRYSPMTEGVRFVQSVTEPAQMEVIMDVCLTENGSLTVEHSIINRSKDPVKVSIYTETPFTRDGFVVIPQGNAASSERPGKIMTLWDGCSWSDERLFIGDRYVMVRSLDEAGKPRLKIGVNDTDGIVGFIGSKGCLIKQYTHNRNALYPFYNCSAFATENNGWLSIQMTSPFYLVEPEEAARHTEIWHPCEAADSAVFHDEESVRVFLEQYMQGK